MSIEVRHTATGVRYDVKLRDPGGRMYQRTFRTKREAVSYQDTERTDRGRGIWVDPRGAATPFGELASEWLTTNPAKRPTTLARDETIVRVHLKPKLGPRPVGTITSREVQSLVNEWCKRAAPRTVRRQYGTLHAILNAAVEAELIGRSPCRGIKLPAVRSTESHIVDADELGVIAAAMRDDIRPMLYLGAVLGLRWAECAGLKVGRLDFLPSTLAVAWQRTRGPGGAMVEGPPKSAAGCRTLTVPAPLMDMLGRHLARRGLTGSDSRAYVFVSPGGGPLDYSHWYQRDWVPAVVGAGHYEETPDPKRPGKTRKKPTLGFHDLRRANATGLVAEGVDLKTAQSRLGHSDPRLTLAVYAQATSEGDRRAAEQMGSRFMRPAAS
ncbi:MAG TPA: site-specific integrase [Acidimicrobiales bacterium]|nr:site-specific integrase [Acidimicrobiales bacterium]